MILYRLLRKWINLYDCSIKKLEIIACPFGELPLIKKDTLDNVIICLVADNRVVTVCGFINLKNNRIEFINHAYVVMKTLGSFTSFDLIKPFETIEELTIALC